MSTYSYLLLDAANTLIYKPALPTTYITVLSNFGHVVAKDEFQLKHKLLSEYFKFPDVTSDSFYKEFNGELLSSLGILSTEEMLTAIFKACKNLPWQSYNDVSYLYETEKPMGVLSNFNTNLNTLLAQKIPDLKLAHVFVSETLGVSKPNPAIFQKALEIINLPAEQILYVGDSLQLDVQPALELGFQVKLIDRDEIYPASPYRINSLKEINL